MPFRIRSAAALLAALILFFSFAVSESAPDVGDLDIEEVEEDTTQVTTYEEEEFPDYNRPITRY